MKYTNVTKATMQTDIKYMLNFYLSKRCLDSVPCASEAKTQRRQAVVENHRKVLLLLKRHGVEGSRLGYIEAALKLAKLNRACL